MSKQITTEAIKSDHQRTHVQALEFWKAVSQHETPRDSEGRLINDRGYVFHYGFTERALGKLTLALLHVLERGEVQNPSNRSSKNRNSLEELEIRTARENASEHKRKEFTVHKTREKNRNDNQIQNEYLLKNKERTRNGTNVSKTCTDNWMPPKEVIIYLSELCESFPKTIDIHILPHFPTKIKVLRHLTKYA